MPRECRKRFPRHRLQRRPLVSDPGMHHGTCVAHVLWCMSGSLTRGDRAKRSPQSRRMRNPQFYVSGKRSIAGRNVQHHFGRGTFHNRLCACLCHIHRQRNRDDCRVSLNSVQLYIWPMSNKNMIYSIFHCLTFSVCLKRLQNVSSICFVHSSSPFTLGIVFLIIKSDFACTSQRYRMHNLKICISID